MISSLTVENLACVRGERRLFDGLSFRVAAGQALSVEGANGAGKTSLLRLIAGLLTQEAGQIALAQDGRSITDGEERGRHVAWLGHQDAIKPQMDVGEQLSFYAALYAQAPNIADALARVGLARQAALPCRYLSAGQKKRLGLARLLVSGRALWLLDEPLAALDAQGRALALDLMAAHCGGGGMVVAATHDPLSLGESLKL